MSELSDDPAATAEALGLVMVLPEEGELQIDIDRDDDLVHFYEMQAVLEASGVYIAVNKQTTSKSGGTHLYVTVNSFPAERITPEIRIAFQAALGSDRKRELLSLLRVMTGVKRPPTLLFEKPEDK